MGSNFEMFSHSIDRAQCASGQVKFKIDERN